MRILYFVQYFNLPHEPGGSRPYQAARAWVRAGHEVTIVTGAVNHKTLSVPAAYRGRLVVSEMVEGIRVLRVWSYAGIRGSFRKRLLNFVSFALCASLVGLARGGGADIVYASSTPLTVGLPGFFNAFLRRKPWCFEVRDLWPQSAVIAGILKEKALATRVARWMSWGFSRSASRVVAVTRGIAQGLEESGVPSGKIVFIPNGVDDWMLAAGETVVEPAEDPFRIVYCGAHGRWNGLGQIIDCAKLLADEPVEFVFVGDGDEKASLIERGRAEGLDNLRFIEAMPKQDAFATLRQGAASIVVTWNHPFQKMVLANKIFDYLAAGRPVLCAAEGEMAKLVREAACGLVVPPEQPEQLAAAVREMMALSPGERSRLGQAGRRYILERYQRRNLAFKLLTIFAELTGLERDMSQGAQGGLIAVDGGAAEGGPRE